MQNSITLGHSSVSNSDYQNSLPENLIPYSKSHFVRLYTLYKMYNLDLSNAYKYATCEDSLNLIRAFEQLEKGNKEIYVGEGGSTLRFFLAYCAATEGVDVTIFGSDKLNTRPITGLVDMLTELGADITLTSKQDILSYPFNSKDSTLQCPVKVKGRKLTGGLLDLDKLRNEGSKIESSQFISAVLIVSGLMENPLIIKGLKNIPSLSYLELTIDIMQRNYSNSLIYDKNRGVLYINPSAFNELLEFEVPMCFSSQFYLHLAGIRYYTFYDSMIMNPEWETFSILTNRSLRTYTIDFSNSPDSFMAICAKVLINRVSIIATGLSTLWNKESSRVEVMQVELAKFGSILTIVDKDTCVIDNSNLHNAVDLEVTIDPHGDHRIAMAFASIARYFKSITILNPDVVNKSYIGFWEMMEVSNPEVKVIE